MALRYTDLDPGSSGARDFIIRRRTPTLFHLFTIFLSALLIAISISLTANDKTMLILSLFAITTCVGWYMLIQTQRNRDALLATEFQNALFASALGVNHEFCMIIRRDGNILYLDRSFQSMFPKFARQSSRSIDTLLAQGRVSHEDSGLVYSAIERGTYEKVIFNIHDDGNLPHKIIMSIEPIMRPSGFVLLRGREFVEKRASGTPSAAGDISSPHISKSTVTLFSHVIDTLNMGVYMTNPTGGIVYANPVLEQWLGFGDGEITARGLSLQDLTQKNGGRTDATPPSDYEGEADLRKKSGGLMKCFINQKVLRDDQGRIIGCTAVAHPFNPGDPEIKKKAVVDAALQLNDFIETAPIAIARLDEGSVVTGGNIAFHALTQHTIEKNLPLPFLTLIPEIEKAETEEIIKKALTGQVPTEAVPLELSLPNGALVMVSAYFSLAKNSAGEKQLLLHLIDITEQKNLELRFAHSQKMQAVGQLAGGVAHDFNNLLTAMIGFCDLLLMRHPAGDQFFADIMQIKQNANRAANLVRQLLAFSRRQTLQPKVLDLTDVLAELSNLIRRLIGENIELKMIHGRDMGHVRADQGQLEQVLINLAVNARDAMLKGGALTIRTSKTEISRTRPLPRNLIAPAEEDKAIPEGEYILVEVADTGCGIPKEILQKIFEPFFSTKEVRSGTGLGLSTVYGIVKQTGGYIYVSSKKDEGTTFSLYFPSVAPEAAMAVATESETAEKAAAVDLTGKGTVLLVEDETPVRIFAARALRNKGYTVLEADCGETAIELMKSHGKEVEVIVTDVIMPGINGPTMIERLAPEFPNVKVIFISGYAEDIFVNNYGSERSFNFLAKPFTLKQLASKIKEVTG